jgi:hypothetical protein
LVCEFRVKGIKFRPEGSFRQRFLPAPAVIRRFRRLHAKRRPVNRTFFKLLHRLILAGEGLKLRAELGCFCSAAVSSSPRTTMHFAGHSCPSSTASFCLAMI